MSICLEPAVLKEPIRASVHHAQRTIRVALLCDMTEENWYSMDLVGEMLFSHLPRGSRTLEIEPTVVRPGLPKALRRSPLLCRRLTGRFLQYPHQLQRLRKQFDVFHLIDHSYAHLVHHLPPDRTVVTCHDLDTFRSILHREQENRSFAFRLMTRRILAGLKKAAHVTCDTAATRDAILKHNILPEHRLSIVHNGVHPALGPLPDRVADAYLSRLLQRAPGDCVELLHVGSIVRRKRIDVLLRVFAAVLKTTPRVRLVRVGGPLTAVQEKLANELGIRKRIDILPHLESNQLAAAYRRASLVLQPSEAEGFGLPVIESLACGTPVLASDIPALREIGGDAVRYCPIDDIQSWCRAVLALLTAPPSRDQLLAHARAFTWGAYATEMAHLYEKVLPR